MITILERLVLKRKNNYSDQDKTKVYALMCNGISILFNLILFCAKMYVGGVSGSAAITADAFNNLADAGTCAAEMLGFAVAGVGAGEIHPFGHGRVEWVMGLIASILVLFMGVEMTRTSIKTIHTAQPLQYSPWTLVVLILSIIVKLYMYYYNKNIGTKISSVTMKAKAYDCLGDLASTTAVLISSLLAYFAGWNIDGWCGTAVSLFILYAGVRALIEAVGPMMGKAPDTDLTAKVQELCGQYPEIIGVYNLMEHDYGFCRRMISFHIGGSHNQDGAKLVKIAAEISRKLTAEIGYETTVQVELLENDPKTNDNLLGSIRYAVEQIDNTIAIEHFRIQQYMNCQTIALDAVLPPEIIKKEKEVKECIAHRIELANEKYCLDISVHMSAGHRGVHRSMT